MKFIVAGVGKDGRSRVVSEQTIPASAPFVGIFASDSSPSARPPGAAALLEQFSIPPGGVRCQAVRFAPDHVADMHHTDTFDVDTVLEGSMELVLDDGAHVLEVGDSAVVPGVDHGWRAGPNGCVFSLVAIGTPPLDA